MSLEPDGTLEKSMITSARSAGPRNRVLPLTLRAVIVRRKYSYPTGVFGRIAGAGRKPPSLAIWIIVGPTALGLGTPPSRPSVGQREGSPVPGAAFTMGTSPALALLSVP